jgi:phage antirepressor YoqD-like protein
MYTRTITIEEADVLREADEIIAGELDELNRPSRYCFTPTEIGRMYGLSGSDLNSFLQDQRIIYKEHGCYHIAKKYRNLGLTAYRYTLHYDRNGHRRMKVSLVWTEEGRRFIVEILRH